MEWGPAEGRAPSLFFHVMEVDDMAKRADWYYHRNG